MKRTLGFVSQTFPATDYADMFVQRINQLQEAEKSRKIRTLSRQEIRELLAEPDREHEQQQR